MTQNCFMASVDLKDAYYSIPVHRSHRKYFKFFWDQKLYQFTCMLNGLSCCPRLFTKILKPPLTALHKKGHFASNYIDDLYLQGQTFAKCKTNVLDTIEQFDSLGFISHPSKSAFEPSQKLIILGFRLDTVKMTISLTGEKAAALAELCQALIDLGRVKIREVARVLGKIIAASRKRGSSLFLTCNGFFHSTQSFARSMYSRNLDLCLFVCKDVICLGGRYFC